MALSIAGRIKSFYRFFVLPASILAATVIGAGVFSLPFVFKSAGALTGSVYLFVMTAVMAAVHLMYADVILRTEGRHRFIGYVRIYLGKLDSYAAAVVVLGMFFALTIYLILASSFIGLLLPQFSAGVKVLIFWLFGSLAIFESVRRLAVTEFLALWGIVAVIAVIFFSGLENAGRLASVPIFDLKNLFLPFAPIAFSLIGRTAVPDVIDYFKDVHNSHRKPAKRAIVWGTVIPAIVYLLFVFGLLTISDGVSEDAVSGLAGRASRIILLLIGVLGLLSLWSTYFVIGQEVKNTLTDDFKFPKAVAAGAVIFVPLLLYIAGFQDFIALIGVAGGVFLALELIFIVLMWRRAELKSEYSSFFFKKYRPFLVYFLVFIFALSVLYEIIYKGFIRWF